MVFRSSKNTSRRRAGGPLEANAPCTSSHTSSQEAVNINQAQENSLLSEVADGTRRRVAYNECMGMGRVI